MIAPRVSEPMFGMPIGPWHTWFAWHPVPTVDRGRVWLRHVNRRRYQTKPYLDGPRFTWFHYAVDGVVESRPPAKDES